MDLVFFHKPMALTSPKPPHRANRGTSGTNVLIGVLLGIHLTLITIGTFCASFAINSTPSHHEEHQAAPSTLCVWACQVGQIAATATPTEHLIVLPLLILLGFILPLTVPLVFSRFSFASPRGPPLL